MEDDFWDGAVVMECLHPRPDGSLATAFNNLWSNLTYEAINITAVFFHKHNFPPLLIYVKDVPLISTNLQKSNMIGLIKSSINFIGV